jgi:hypothetical protein
MCVGPIAPILKFVAPMILSQIFGNRNQTPQGPKTHARGLANKLARPGAQMEEDRIVDESKKEKSKLSQAQEEGRTRKAEGTAGQMGKTEQTTSDLGTTSGVTEAGVGGITDPNRQNTTATY